MRKLILVVLMVAMVATPCIAQEIEPEGIFSLHGTTWVATVICINFVEEIHLGFYQGKIYRRYSSGSWYELSSFYVDLLAISFCAYGEGGAPVGELFYGIMSPLGFGFGFYWMCPSILIKTDNNWTPPPEEE